MGRGREADDDHPVEPEKAPEDDRDPGAARLSGGGPNPGAETGGRSSRGGTGGGYTVDRIAHLWGERTLCGPGEDWPVRVDQFLEDGVSEDEVDRWVQTASILHSNGDALDIAVKDGRMVGVRGRAVDRVNKGRLEPQRRPPRRR